MTSDEISSLISAGLDTERVDVVSDDGTHFACLVVSQEFDGLRPLQRHQRIYEALGDKVGGEIHALSIRALTPGEWRRQGG